jgi:hypothetical protein
MDGIRTKKSHSCLNPFSLQQLITVVAKFRFNKHFNSVKTQFSNQKNNNSNLPIRPIYFKSYFELLIRKLGLEWHGYIVLLISLTRDGVKVRVGLQRNSYTK